MHGATAAATAASWKRHNEQVQQPAVQSRNDPAKQRA